MTHISEPSEPNTSAHASGQGDTSASDSTATTSAPATEPTATGDFLTDETPVAAGEVPIDAPELSALELTDDRLLSILESMLFVADAPITAAALARLLRLEDASRVRDVLRARVERDAHSPVGIRLYELANGYQLRTAPENAGFATLMAKVRPVKLTRAQLETLAIVAYRRQVTRAQVEYLRGVDDCGGPLKALLDHKLIRIIGHDMDLPHKPAIYSTTPAFLEFLGLKSLDQLPSAQEYIDLTDASKKRFEQKLGEPFEQGILAGLFPNENETADAAEVDDQDPALNELAEALKGMLDTDRDVAEKTGLAPKPATALEGAALATPPPTQPHGDPLADALRQHDHTDSPKP